MSLYDVRRQRRSRPRSKPPAASCAAPRRPDQTTGVPGADRSTAMQPGASAASASKRGDGRVVIRRGRAGRRDVAVVVAGEQQPAERRVAAVPRARPPDDRLVLGARQRDVGEPQVLAALLDDVLLLVAFEVRALEPDVDRARVAGVGVVEEDRLGVRRDVARAPRGTGR